MRSSPPPPPPPPVAPWPNPPGDLSAIAWIPPPPIYGFPLPFGNMDPALPHYYYPGGNPTEPASRASPCSVAGCTWPNVQDVPLPSAFPLPPSLMSMLPPSFAGAPGLPPPLPWWVMEGQQQQQQQPPLPEKPQPEVRRARRAASSERTTRRPRAQQQEAEEPTRAPHRRLSRPSQPATRTQATGGGKRYHTASAAAASPPLPLSSSEGEQRMVPRRPRRAASQRAPPVERGSDADVDEPPRRSRSRSSSSSPVGTAALERKSLSHDSVQRKTDIYLQGIEDVYKKLRASYEAFVRDPSLFLQGAGLETSSGVPTTTSSAPSVSSVRQASTSSSSEEERAPRLSLPVREVDANVRATQQKAAPMTAMKSSQNHRSSVTATAGAARAKRRDATEKEEHAATFTASRTNQVVTSQLRNELLRLESQWQRLEELKQNGAHAKNTRTVSGAARRSPSSSSFTGSGGGGAGAANTSAVPPSNGDGTRTTTTYHPNGGGASNASQKFNLTREKIMALIQERKNVIGVR